jgi:hypothetical protein
MNPGGFIMKKPYTIQEEDSERMVACSYPLILPREKREIPDFREEGEK